MQELISFAEINKRYEGEWVLIIDPVTKKNLEIIEGTVACHSLDRDEVYHRAMELRPKHSAILFLGRPPRTWSLPCEAQV